MATLRVLLVDDNHLLRLTIAEFLCDEGFEVIEAENGCEAARRLDDAGAFDVLLTDLEMPGSLNGVDVAARARERDPIIAVLIITGSRIERYASGLDLLDPPAVVFSKPFRMHEIADTIRRLAS